MRFATILAVTGLALATAAPAAAKTWEVKMVNRGTMGMMAFEPSYLKVAPGDTVKFVPQDMGHNAESIPAMTPAGGEAFKGTINQAISVTLRKPGLYGYECRPHTGLGMVGLIQVGAPANKAAVIDAAATLPPLAKTRMTKLLDLAK